MTELTAELLQALARVDLFFDDGPTAEGEDIAADASRKPGH